MNEHMIKLGPHIQRLHSACSLMPRMLVFCFLVFWPLALLAQANQFAAANDVTWNAAGKNENNSMPLGNGNVALNVWTEQNGDIVLLLAKSDAWSENGQLLKLGRVRVKLTPNPFAPPAALTQTLKLEAGEVQIQAGKNVARVWVDANHPVVHLEVQTEQPVQLEARSELWRSNSYHLGLRRFRGGASSNGATIRTVSILGPTRFCRRRIIAFPGVTSIPTAFTRWYSSASIWSHCCHVIRTRFCIVALESP